MQITGDDYPTYEDSVNMSLAEQARVRTEEMEDSKKLDDQLKRDAINDKILLSRALHRLACIESDIEIIARHITRYDSDKIFKLPSLNPDGSVFADEAWHNISNIEIACDLNNKESLEWESRVKNNLK
tara:strand:- start:239 stop:622 length:384 start_codon:yes stop_codon:yes gene_type:complete